MQEKTIAIILKIAEIISNIIVAIKKDKTSEKGEKTNDQPGSN